MGGIFNGPVSTEIGITVAIERHFSRRIEYESLFTSSLQVSDDALDCLGMRLLGIGGESGTLVHGISDIRPSVMLQVLKHSDDRGIMPIVLVPLSMHQHLVQWGSVP